MILVATHTSGCTKFEPTTTVGVGPVEVEVNPNTKTLYEANQHDNTVSVIDTTVCNQRNLTGCNQTWPTVPVGTTSRHIGINKATNTIYVSNRDDGTLSIINGATCNRDSRAVRSCGPSSSSCARVLRPAGTRICLLRMRRAVWRRGQPGAW